MHVLESKRSVACEEAAGNQERCYELFPVIFVSLTSSSLPKGAAATSPKPGCEEQHAPTETPCIPCLWNNTLSFQMTGKGFQSEIMPRLVLFLTSTPEVSLWHLRRSVELSSLHCALCAAGLPRALGKSLTKTFLGVLR